jgi:hypothetical protein
LLRLHRHHLRGGPPFNGGQWSAAQHGCQRAAWARTRETKQRGQHNCRKPPGGGRHHPFVSIVFLLSVSNFGLSVTGLYSVYHRLVTTWSQIEKICTHLTDFLRGEVNIKMMIKIK